ncbi:MAG: hypothetical protein AB1397_00985 [bacterium]
MKLSTVITIVIGYLGWVIISFFMLNRMADEIRLKAPSLIDKRWKRILWVLSCFLFVPIVVGIPYFAIDAVKEFISEDKK